MRSEKKNIKKEYEKVSIRTEKIEDVGLTIALIGIFGAGIGFLALVVLCKSSLLPLLPVFGGSILTFLGFAIMSLGFRHSRKKTEELRKKWSQLYLRI